MVGRSASGFKVLEKHPWTFYLCPSRADALMDSDFSDPDALIRKGTPISTGRSAAVVFQFENGRGVLRELRHGGMFRALTGGAFFSRKRPLSEIEILELAGTGGLSVPEPLAAAVRRSGFGFRAFVATRLIENAVELAGCFGRALRPDPSERHAILSACGREVRHMHDAGILHADLHARNILVVLGKRPLAYILDFDKAVVRNAVSVRERQMNLLRLGRSVDKLPRDARPSNKDMTRFMKAYLAAGAPLDFNLRSFAWRLAVHRRIHRLTRKLPGQKKRLY